MYHIYKVEIQNEGFDLHIYSENMKNVVKMIQSINDTITKECRNLSKSINYQLISTELKSGIECHSEKREIEKFFSKFYKPLSKEEGIIGGYVLEYRKCSVRKKSEMPFKIMLSYLDMISDNNFFTVNEVYPVYVAGSEINLHDHNKHIKLTFGMEKVYEYGNEALLSVARASLNFELNYSGEDECKRRDIFIVEFNTIVQLCQFLNYLPFIYIYHVSFV